MIRLAVPSSLATTWSIFPLTHAPNIKQLGNGKSSGYCSIISPDIIHDSISFIFIPLCLILSSAWFENNSISFLQYSWIFLISITLLYLASFSEICYTQFTWERWQVPPSLACLSCCYTALFWSFRVLWRFSSIFWILAFFFSVSSSSLASFRSSIRNLMNPLNCLSVIPICSMCSPFSSLPLVTCKLVPYKYYYITNISVLQVLIIFYFLLISWNYFQYIPRLTF